MKSLVMLDHKQVSTFYLKPPIYCPSAFYCPPHSKFGFSSSRKHIHLVITPNFSDITIWKSKKKKVMELNFFSFLKSYLSCKWSQAVCLGNGNNQEKGWWMDFSTVAFFAPGISKTVAGLRNEKKITDNSSEAQSCLFLCPTCLKCSFFVSLVVHGPCRICSKRLLSFSQVQLRRACPSMCVDMLVQHSSFFSPIW